MKRLLTAAILASVPAASFADTVTVPSTGSVPETVERLKTSVEDAGAKVFSYFLGIAPGRYEAVLPAFVSG